MINIKRLVVVSTVASVVAISGFVSTMNAETDSANDSGNGTVAYLDYDAHFIMEAASGLPTGKRQHKPLTLWSDSLR